MTKRITLAFIFTLLFAAFAISSNLTSFKPNKAPVYISSIYAVYINCSGTHNRKPILLFLYYSAFLEKGTFLSFHVKQNLSL